MREACDCSKLPPGWDCIPPGRISRDLGNAWLGEGRSPILVVPSVLIPEEHNILLNPAHPALRRLAAVKLRRWSYDPRLLGVPLTL